MSILVAYLSYITPIHAVSVAVGAVALLLMGFYWFGYEAYSKLATLGIPGPKPHAFVGNIPDVKEAGGLHTYFLQCLKKYGEVFTICLGRSVSIVVADPEILKQVMVKEFPNFINRYHTVSPKPPFGKNVFHSKDEDWKRIRKLLTPSFSTAKLKQMLTLIDDVSNTLIKKIVEIADTGTSVDISKWYSQMSLDGILSTAFGMESDVQTNNNSKLLEESKKMFGRPPTFINFLLALPFGWILRALFFYVNGSLRYFVDLATGIIRIRRAEIQKGNQGRKDLLRSMLNSQEEGKDIGLTDEEIVAQCTLFILAGQETISTSLSFISYHLAVNPDIQEKLHVEIETAVQSNTGIPMYDLVQKIEYLDCVISEAQRLHPGVYRMNRECKKSCKINGVNIPAGTEVIIPIYALHNDPDAWPDVEKFDPERFRGPNKESIHPYQFMPFGAGPRNCIGMRFALVEIKLTLVKIMRRFRFVCSPETQVPLMLNAGESLTARDGVHIRLETHP